MGFFTRKEDGAGSGDAPGKRARGKRATGRDGSVDPLDPLELAKKRARRRLIGAIALVAGAVVLLPMVFDSEPKNASDDLSVEIPSQNSSFNPALPVPPSSTSASALAVAPPAAQSTLVPGAPLTAAESSGAKPATPVTVPATASGSPGSASVTPRASPSAPPTSVPPTSVPTSPGVTSSAPATTSKQADNKIDKAAQKSTPATSHADDPRALAALEGKDITPTSASEHGTQTFAVQIGAFSNADKVKEVRDRLQAAGLKPYTENLSTAQGGRTRVRVGPFATHEAAEAAREKVKGLGYDGSVVTL